MNKTQVNKKLFTKVKKKNQVQRQSSDLIVVH